MTVQVLADVIDEAEELRRFTRNCDNVGAVVTFTGVVRGSAKSGTAVHSLLIEQYPGKTALSIKKIADATARHFDVENLLIRHRIGEMQPGETIVFVAISSAHRTAAFEACEFVMDHLKSRAMFWKKEVTDSGSAWIEPTTDDYTALDRWGERALTFEDLITP